MDLVYPSVDNVQTPTTANVTATINGIRCDYATLTGVSLAAVRVVVANGAINVSKPVLNTALAQANAAVTCPPLAPARRALAGHDDAAAAAGQLRRRQAQAPPSGTQSWANLNVQIASASTAAVLAAIVAAVSTATPASFPLTTAAWAPVWALAPATWIADFGSPFIITSPPQGSNAVSFSPAPTPPGLSSQQQLGLGLGVGLTLALILVLFGVCACRMVCYPTRATTQLRVVESSTKQVAAASGQLTVRPSQAAA